jgi:gluconolactonase
MPDASVILVEYKRRTLSRVTLDGRIHVIAALGGGPNGARAQGRSLRVRHRTFRA